MSEKMDIEVLRDTLRLAIKDLNDKPITIQKEFKKMMVHMYNYPVGDSTYILNGKTPMEALSFEDLYKLARVLYELYKLKDITFSLEKLNVDKYFNENQKVNFEQKYINSPLFGDIIISDWLKVNYDQYIVTVPISEVIKWRDSRRIKYNERTQREMTVKEVDGVIVKKITLNKIARKEIESLMKKNEFISNALTLNINPDHHNPPFIEDGNLVIPGDSEIDIADGFHRYLAMTEVKDNNPEWEFNCVFFITIFNEAKSNRFIWQEDHKTHLKAAQRETMNKSDDLNYWLNRLNESDDFHLKGRLSSEDLYVISKCIRKYFQTKDFVFDKDHRENGLYIKNMLEKNINTFIEAKNLFKEGIPDIGEWLIYIAAMKKAEDNNISFMKLIDKIDIDNALEQTNFKLEPKTKHFKAIDKILSEVIVNV